MMKKRMVLVALVSGALTGSALLADDDQGDNRNACKDVPSQSALKAALKAAAPSINNTVNGGLNNNMWGTIVNRDGVVCAVAFTGADRGSQWPGSRVISAQSKHSERIQPGEIRSFDS